MGWTYTLHEVKIHDYEVWMENTKTGDHFEDLGSTWKDIINMLLKDTGHDTVDWMQLAH
jgi:hypothetical protein